MSHLIRSREAVTTTPLNLVDLVAPQVSQALTSSASSVTLPVSARCGHRCPRTPDTTSTSTTDASGSQQAKKNTRGPCCQLKTAKVTWVTNGRIMIRYDGQHLFAPTGEQHNALAYDIGHVVRTYCHMQWKSWKAMPDEVRMKTNYNFNDINDDMLAYFNRLFAKRYKQWKSDLHQYFETFDDSLVALEEGCPKEFEDWEDNWVWLCNHFQESSYVKKAKANKINREKKTFLHHLGLRPFSYRMEGVQNSRRSMSLETFMFDLGMSPPPSFFPRLRSSMWIPSRMWGGWGIPGDGNLEPFHHRS
ncbi:hypothetical protein D8674_019123 [Pyrus ussuriensis x Pyrus communis]|uniref:Uncharacterized protein n=1 Tax=Pyrus ussuriensis x Pyrus communis TaxID=2448454 RepID=A0A5N5GBF4_9ROSA|nr:hypothetical protein D8674_019123 [Pyrus ussuriensis x Pyrus communis]